MSSEFIEILGAFPDRSEDRGELEHALGAMMRQIASRPVPAGRVVRLWSLGTLQVRLAGLKLFQLVEAGILRDEERRALVRQKHELRAALDVLRTMGYLRGMVAKVGQLLAAWPRLAPDRVCELLDSLHFQAPPMHYALVESQVETELGGPPERVFARFEETAFAAASIGQVHAASLKSGEDVAVKIQYPGIGRTIHSDVKNLRILMTPLRLTRDWDNIVSKLEDVEATLTREADYRQEATYTETARRHLQNLDGVVVPRVIHEHSSDRVLVTERLRGRHLREWLADRPSRAERERVAALLFTAVSRLFYSARMVWADPSPGNVLVLDDGRVGLLDFGCCLVHDDADWDLTERVLREFTADGRPSDASLAEACDVLPENMGKHAELLCLVREFVAWLWEPILEDAPYAVNDAYMDRGIELLRHMGQKRLVRSKPFNTWTNRFYLGFRSLLWRLDAPINLKQLHDAELRRAGHLPPAQP